MIGVGFLLRRQRNGKKAENYFLTRTDFSGILRFLSPGSRCAPCKLNNVRTRKHQKRKALFGVGVEAGRQRLPRKKRLLTIL